jgi:hypothetical protein
MTDVKTDGIYNLLRPVIMSFPQLLEPKAFVENGKPKGDPKYSANFNFEAESEDLKALKTLAAKLARAKWPDQPFFLTTQEGIKIPQIIFPFASGDKFADARKAKGKDDGEYMRGKVVVSSRSKYEPRLSYIDANGHIVDLEGEMAKQAAKGKFYPGVEVLAQFNLVPYDAVGNNGKAGVKAYLNMVLSTGKGARISGGQTAAEAFKGYIGSVSAENPMGPGATADMSDEIPY